MIAAGWATQKERGNSVLVGMMISVTLGLGWWAGRMLLLPITVFFLASSRAARVASRGFLARALGRPVGFFDVFRHFHCFACVTLDRLFLLTNRLDLFDFSVEGVGALKHALAQGRGCVLLGGHLGSFAALRAIASDCPARIRPMMYRANEAALSQAIARLNLGLASDIIEIGGVAAMLEAREAVARGEIVGLLADRAPGGQKSIGVDFLAAAAGFPTGPIVLASMLAVPVFLFFAVRTGPRRYRVMVEPFAETIALRRDSRAADVRVWVERYAARLARHCQDYPFNWFNFYEFWAVSR